jgi:mannose/fructose-specific phosphotransferase system component IIA
MQGWVVRGHEEEVEEMLESAHSFCGEELVVDAVRMGR